MSPGTGSKRAAEPGVPPPRDERTEVPRWRVAIGLVGALVGFAALLALILPRSDEVEAALREVGIGRFAAVVLLGLLALVCRTAAWQVAIRAAGGRVRAIEAHAASAVSYSVALLLAYLGVIVRIAVIRNIAPERSPTTSQQIAAESLLVVVEAALVGLLILCASWTLGIDFLTALLIFTAGLLAAGALVLAARRFESRRFGAGLAAARRPGSLGLVTGAIACTLGAQIARVALVLAAMGLDASPLVVVAVFLASGLGAVIPVGTAVSGAAAPLLAASAGSGSIADAAAAGVLLGGGLLVSIAVYLAVSLMTAAAARSLPRSRAQPGGG